MTADHGGEFLEHGLCDHLTRVHHELLRVPLIVHMPREGRAAGARNL